MNFRFQDNCKNIDWEEIPNLLKEVGMSFSTPSIHQISFEASFAVVFVFDKSILVGLGRILSDGVRQAAIYDVAVNRNYQGQKIGKAIIEHLVQKAPNCNFILYASPGKEEFYRKLGFGKMKTGMALFTDPNSMIEKGFIEK